MRHPILLAILLGPAPAMAATDDAPQSQVCVQVSIGGEAAPDYGCLNQKLGEQARTAQHVTNLPPLDATAPGPRTGGFNQAALGQQFGKAWGSSAAPYRPPLPVYANPLTGR